MQRLLREGPLPLAAVFPVAIPFLFLHKQYLPHLSVGAGSTSLQIELADLAVLAVALAALADGVRRGFGPLRAGRWIWLAGAVLLVLVLATTAYGRARTSAYPFSTHLVTALKFVEYGALALAVPLLVRTRRELELLLWSVAGWSAVASVVGVVQFLGWRIFVTSPAFERQHSFLGPTNFAALSGLALLLALATLALGRGTIGPPRLALLAGIAGAVGSALAATVSELLGVGAAAVALVLLALLGRRLDVRRLAALVAVFGAVAAFALVLRAGDLTQFGRFLGLRHEQRSTTTSIQTYSQHTLLAYVGWRIFVGHPLLGVGWKGSDDPFAFEPALPAAHRRFPDVAPLAFPSRRHRWGVQMAYVQALADMGIVGFAAFVALLATGLLRAARLSLRGPPWPPTAVLGLTWTILAAAMWTTVGLVAGDPLDALHWLALGLCAAPVLSTG